MSDYDIHSCGYYCHRPACIEAQRNELRDKLFEIRTSERSIQTSDKETPESSQPTEPTMDGWPLYSGLPPIKVQDKTFEEFAQSFAQSARVNGIPEPEPVAYINVEKRELEWAKLTRWETPTTVKMDKIPLYTKKEWVGLTLDEIDDIGVRFALMRGGDIDAKDWFDFYKAIEAKLKEKNA
jgi:hypothetical protein